MGRFLRAVEIIEYVDEENEATAGNCHGNARRRIISAPFFHRSVKITIIDVHVTVVRNKDRA